MLRSRHASAGSFASSVILLVEIAKIWPRALQLPTPGRKRVPAFFRCRVDALRAGGHGGNGLPASRCGKGEVSSVTV